MALLHGLLLLLRPSSPQEELARPGQLLTSLQRESQVLEDPRHGTDRTGRAPPSTFMVLQTPVKCQGKPGPGAERTQRKEKQRPLCVQALAAKSSREGGKRKMPYKEKLCRVRSRGGDTTTQAQAPHLPWVNGRPVCSLPLPPG